MARKYDKARGDVLSLRVTERLSLTELVAAFPDIPKRTIAEWISGTPLSVDEMTKRRSKNSARLRFSRSIPPPTPSKFFAFVEGQSLTRSRKAQIAEAAVLFRLALHGFSVSSPVFDCDRSDWLVLKGSKAAKIQVKWAGRSKNLHGQHARPHIGIRCKDYSSPSPFKVRSYEKGDLDFIVGYDLTTDTAYVLSLDEISHRKAAVRLRDDCAERWDKISEFLNGV